MSNRFFSLIHGSTVHLAPNTKVIKEEALAALKNSEEILEAVQEDAKLYKKEVAIEFEKERVLATAEGFEEGFSQWSKKIAELEMEIQKVRSDVEKAIVPIALKAAKKILGRELETSPQAVVDVVKQSLKGVAQHKKVTIWVNKDDWAALDKEKEKLKGLFERLESLSIRQRDDIGRGGCVIETEAGIINAQLDNQWLILESAFEKMMQS